MAEGRAKLGKRQEAENETRLMPIVLSAPVDRALAALQKRERLRPSHLLENPAEFICIVTVARPALHRVEKHKETNTDGRAQ